LTQGVSGNFAATTNASLGFGNVTNFAVTMWFKQSILLANTIGPRMFVFGNSTNTDCGTTNSIGMKFQNASELQFFVNTIQATASFSSSLPISNWVFVAMAYDGSNVTLYEGTDLTPATLISTTATAGQTIPLGSAASLFLGNRLARDRDFAGWIDDFRFYTGAGDLSFVESIRQSAAGPAGLTGVAGNNLASLTWNALLGATSYNIKRSTTSGGIYSTISTSGTVTGTNYVDSTAANGTTYYYVVSAATSISKSSETANSPTEVSVTPVAPLPVFMSIRTSGNSIIITWPNGTLQSATNIVGPWHDFGGVVSPYGITPTGSQQFYRVKVQ
jgi:hypothetical protein